MLLRQPASDIWLSRQQLPRWVSIVFEMLKFVKLFKNRILYNQIVEWAESCRIDLSVNHKKVLRKERNKNTFCLPWEVTNDVHQSLHLKRKDIFPLPDMSFIKHNG